MCCALVMFAGRAFAEEPEQGVALTSSKQITLTVSGFMHLRNTTTLPSEEDAGNRLAVQRVRLLFTGTIGSPNITYRVNAGLGAGDADPDSKTLPLLHAVWVESKHLRDLNVRFGQMRPLLDRQRSVFIANQQFVDRPPALLELAVAQDVGLQLSSLDLFGLGTRLRYWLFVGSGDGRNQQVTRPIGFLYVGRVELSPWGSFDDTVEGDFQRTRAPRLTFGVGAAYNHKAQRSRGNIGAYHTLGGFNHAYVAADVTVKYAGLSMILEAMARRSGSEMRTGLVDGMAITEYSRSAVGMLAQVGYMTPWFIEGSTRFTVLRAPWDTDPALAQDIAERGRELGAATSWYVNRDHGLKLQADYSYQFGRVRGGERHEVRAQVQASF